MTMRFSGRTTTTTALAFLVAGGLAHGADDVQALEQRLRAVERQLEIQREAAAEAAKKTPVVSAGEKGFAVKSPDGAYELKLRALTQFDGRFFPDDNAANSDTLQFRRVRPTLEGSLGKLIGFRLTPEFAGNSASLVDAYADFRFDPAATVRVGKVKGPVGLERLQGGGVTTFIERGFPTELVPNRELGVQLQGALLDNTLTYALGWFNGAADGRDAPASDADNNKELAGRIFLEPFRNTPGFFQGLGFGIAGTDGRKDPGGTADTGTDAKPQYRTPGQNRFFKYDDSVLAAGDQTRWSPQLYFYRNSFGLLAEYVESRQRLAKGPVEDDISNTAWQVAASYVLTGESASYRGIGTHKDAFVPGGAGWGAFEVAARYGVLDVDNAAFDRGFASINSQASEARAWTLGVNWYLTANAKLALNYSLTTFDGGAAGGSDRNDEKALFTRAQISF
jgi:phosphate-selective porin OprO/OprP